MYSKFWDHERIVNYIKDLHAKGEPLYSSYVHEHHATLHRAAFRYFGNWEGAITAAGLDYSEVARYRRWTRRLILKQLRELYRKGEDLSWRQISSGKYSALAYAAVSKRYFGSWEATLEAAEIPYDDVARYIKWTPERIVSEISTYHHQGVELAARNIQKVDAGLYHSACRTYGSWRKAIEMAGLIYVEIAYRVQRSREEVLHILGDLRQKGVVFTDTNMRAQYPALHASAVRHFGTWSSARRKIGIDCDYRSASQTK